VSKSKSPAVSNIVMTAVHISGITLTPHPKKIVLPAGKNTPSEKSFTNAPGAESS
jgi:hypothetical protein